MDGNRSLVGFLVCVAPYYPPSPPTTMSSSSTTACSRSPSPSPATPESADGLDSVLNKDDLSAWCSSLSPTNYLFEEEAQFPSPGKADGAQILELEDLLQDGAFQESSPPMSDGHVVLDPRVISKLALPSGSDTTSFAARPHNVMPATKPVPPPPSQPRPDPALNAQRVVYPPKETCYNLPIMVPSIPEGGTKSRVETQVRLTVDLAHASASSGEPPKYDRVGSWKWLRLPRGTSTKRRTRKEGKIDAPAEDTLYLTTEVFCSTAPHTRVTCCGSCQAREAKRVARKIAARVRPARSDTESQDDAPIIPGRGKHEDTSNIVQFNCPEILDFSTGSVVLPLRITCYCRHHREKAGFNVHFTMLDHIGRVVGTGVTRPIMITDDHKTTGANAKAHEPKHGLEWPLGDTDVSARRKKPRLDTAFERSKKRSKPYDTAQRNARRGSIVSVDPSSRATSTIATRPSSPLQNFASSPMPSFSQIEQAMSSGVDPASPPQMHQIPSTTFDFSGPLPTDAPPSMFDQDVTMAQEFNPETITFEQLLNTYSPPPAPPAPASPVPLALDPTQALSVPQQSPPFLLFNQQNPPPITALPPPRIHRLIPSSGPTYGGIEVTVLGANFHPSMQLNCTFGGTTSSSTQRWSDNTLVCMLPPSPTAGVVNVWFEGLHKQEDGTPPCLFTYTDETDKALMELALQVVGLKMTGKIEDARNVAMRIVGNTGSDDSSGGARSSNAMQLAGELDIPRDLRHLLLSRAGSNGDFETVILNFLSVLDIAIDRPTLSLASSISHQTASGQTLLHLAVMAKFPALVRFLIAHEIDIDVRDKNGCTALFLAAVVRSTECAKALIEAGAALDIVNALGKTPEDVAPEGFFDAIFVISDDDEAAWGDVEEESESDEPARPAPPRRARKSFVRRRRLSHFTRDITPQSKTPQRPAARPAESKSKKALEAGMADEKQVASFMDMFSRTLAQWQHPQGMIPNMPNLPLPHLPHLPLPAIPAWNALPQMPAVFPVLVPITAISQLWGEKRVGEKSAGESEDDKDAGARSKQAVPTTQDWRAFWEKLVTQGGESPQTHDEISDAPPPAYSPRRSDSCELPADVKVPLSEPVASSSGVMLPPSSERIVSRHIGYESLPLPEQEVNAYAYRPAHKSLRKQQKKQDRMLFWFWIPILLFGLTWAFVHFMRVAFHATRALSIKAGLTV